MWSPSDPILREGPDGQKPLSRMDGGAQVSAWMPED